MAQEGLAKFAAGPWGVKCPTIAQSWQCALLHVTPFCAFPQVVRRVIYTTNAIVSGLNCSGPKRQLS